MDPPPLLLPIRNNSAILAEKKTWYTDGVRIGPITIILKYSGIVCLLWRIEK